MILCCIYLEFMIRNLKFMFRRTPKVVSDCQAKLNIAYLD